MVSESMRLSVYHGDEIRPRSKDHIDPSDKLSRTALMLRGSSFGYPQISKWVHQVSY